ncbi:hypothetical protein K227x_28870 [Rubripirellula lacrimiformis]|uniref:Glycerophosphoryl diester phosphodiesterase membrane domain-containing protein n=1 Tax=Rubripirellula lacrimiformis TaxID=1930273 RepID=A0A517NBH9_9BACT|nr:hypothetical protein [Rubripirellula lacrimiformis]QDT04495.1 hypothetical protein K227x_28870 [Rubripirellula lacrimiformis]
MSQANPYAPTTSIPINDTDIRRVAIRPIGLLKRSWRMLGDQYWLFLGITFGGILIGSVVPFGLILGPMLVGIYLCYLSLERREKVEFGTVFKGFDFFKESFIATLCLIALTMVVMIPFMIAMAVLIMPTFAQAAQNNQPPSFPVAIFLMYPLMLMANIVITLPFIFTFQLIADRNLSAMEAIKASIQGVRKNLWGIVWFFALLMIISFALACMCYVPAILFLPVSFGSLFLLYRDIYPHQGGADPAANTFG